MQYTTPSGEVLLIGGVYNFLRSLRKIERTQLRVGGSIYFLFDNASSINGRRKQIDPDYKSNRFRKDPVFYRGLDYLHLILLAYDENNFTLKCEGLEADDLVEAICKNFKPTDSVLLVSNDHDWARGITENVHWYVRKEKGETITYTKEKYLEAFGFIPTRESICMFKSFHGDDIDKVPNAVPGIPREVLMKIVTDFQDLKTLFFQLEIHGVSYISEVWKNKILNAKGRLMLNWELVDYQAVSQKQLKEDLTPTHYEPKTLRGLYHALGFNVEKLDPRPEILGQEEKLEKGKTFFEFERVRRA
jgi:5'-3' exonuclease